MRPAGLVEATGRAVKLTGRAVKASGGAGRGDRRGGQGDRQPARSCVRSALSAPRAGLPLCHPERSEGSRPRRKPGPTAILPINPATPGLRSLPGHSFSTAASLSAVFPARWRHVRQESSHNTQACGRDTAL